jgi:hypothetical protein
MTPTAMVECGVCGAVSSLGAGSTVKAAEIAAFSAAHSVHDGFLIHLSLGMDDSSATAHARLPIASGPA